MRIPASSVARPTTDAHPRNDATARDAYLDRLSASLGVDRTRMIVSAWSDGTVPSWLRETDPEPAIRRTPRRHGVSTIRQTTTACVMAALGSCLLLYWGKSQAALLDREVGRSVRATQAAHAQVNTLRAEWALLNQPDRLQNLAGHYLALQPVAPAQFADMAKLAERLQPPVAAAAGVEEPPDGAEPARPAPAPHDNAVAARASEPAQPDASGATAPVALAQAQPRAHPTIKALGPTRYLTPMIAEARQPVRVRDSGEALLNGDPEPVRWHAHIVRASATAGWPALPHAEPGLRPTHRVAVPRFDLPHWLMETHGAHPARSNLPHTLVAPQENAIALATPVPAATVQRVIARPAPELPPLPQAAPAEDATRTEDAPRYRPAYRRNYAYGTPYRPSWGQPYGYGNPYYGYGTPYYRGYAPPPPQGGYYQ